MLLGTTRDKNVKNFQYLQGKSSFLKFYLYEKVLISSLKRLDFRRNRVLGRCQLLISLNTFLHSSLSWGLFPWNELGTIFSCGLLEEGIIASPRFFFSLQDLLVYGFMEFEFHKPLGSLPQPHIFYELLFSELLWYILCVWDQLEGILNSYSLFFLQIFVFLFFSL